MKNIKSYKLFEQDMSDTQYHTDLIKDLLSDVIDEFGIDEYDIGDPTGIFYSLLPNTYGIEKDKGCLRLWIANLVDGAAPSDEINNTIVSSKVLKDFEERLKSIGYTITKENYRYYEVYIEYDQNEKIVESSDSEYYSQIVKDVFQDIIDDYDIDEAGNPNFIGGGETDGLYYSIKKHSEHKTITLYIRKYDRGLLMPLDIDLSKHIERLKSMGFRVLDRTITKDERLSGNRRQIILEISYDGINEGFDEYVNDKISNYWPSNTKDIAKHTMLDIRDVFQDILDEYDFDSSYLQHESHPPGYFYDFNLASCEFLYFNLYSPTDKYLWQEILPFVKRLKSMGYKVRACSSSDDSYNSKNMSNFTNPERDVIHYAVLVYYPDNISEGVEEYVNNKVNNVFSKADKDVAKHTMLDIKDVFQELIDDYYFEFEFDTRYHYPSGYFANFNLATREFLYFNIFSPKDKNLWEEFLLCVKRLEKMGYEVRTQSSNGGSYNIGDYDFVNPGENVIQYAVMVYYPDNISEGFEEYLDNVISNSSFASKKKTDMKYVVMDVKDVFQELLDEYFFDHSIDRFTTPASDYCYNFNLSPGDKFSNRFFYFNIFCPSRVDIWDEILPNIKRLESMGYEVEAVSSDGKNRYNLAPEKNFTNAGSKMQYAIRVYY